jgi:hypothetical protein
MSFHPHHCNGCSSRWAGSVTSHCAGCHLTFTGLTAFDEHRTGSHQQRSCLPPEGAGLALTGRLYPCWGLPDVDSSDYMEVEDD